MLKKMENVSLYIYILEIVFFFNSENWKNSLSKLKSAFALRIDFLNLGQFYFSIFA